jgi:hypothetical protein
MVHPRPHRHIQAGLQVAASWQAQRRRQPLHLCSKTAAPRLLLLLLLLLLSFLLMLFLL